MTTFATKFPFTSRGEANAAAEATGCTMIMRRNELVDGAIVSRWRLFPREEQGEEVAVEARSERHVYTPSGKKSTSRIQAGKAFKMFPNDRKAMIAQAVAFGVKPSTANAMYSHYKVGRYTA